MAKSKTGKTAVKILSRRKGFRGFFRVDVYRLRHRLFGGGWSDVIEREIYERGKTSGVLLYDPQRDAVVLVEQFRLPSLVAGFSGWELEMVAGIIGPKDTTPARVAIRETKEETGLEVIGKPIKIHQVMPSPGGLSEVFNIFCARVDARRAAGIHGLAQENEDIRVVVKSFRQVTKLVKAGRIRNGSSLLALYWLAANRARLRRLWR
jgi:ADP-ribose pyrophosphatase